MKELLKVDNNQEFNNLIKEYHANDIASFYHGLNNIDRVLLLSKCSNEVLTELIPYLDFVTIKDFFYNLELPRQVEILNDMSSDDEVDFLKKIDFKLRKVIIKELYDQEKIVSLLKYDEDMSGAYMNYEMVRVRPDYDVKDATKSLIKMAPQVEKIGSLFVTDDDNKYLGIVSLRTLIKTKSPMKIEEIMEYIKPSLDTSDINEMANRMSLYKIYEMPIVDEDNYLLGMVTNDDAMDILSESATEDFEKLAALPETKNENAVKTAIHRLPWLIVLTMLSIPIFFLTAIFEKSLAGIAILVVLEPLMLGTPGNIATQTLGVSLQELNDTGKLKFSTFIREFISGIYTALFLASIAFVVAYIFMYIKPPSYAPESIIKYVGITINKFSPALVFSFILSISLFIVIIISPLLAVIIPLLLKLMRLDPAVASGPFITTIIDITSVGLYFTIALAILQAIGVLR